MMSSSSSCSFLSLLLLLLVLAPQAKLTHGFTISTSNSIRSSTTCSRAAAAIVKTSTTKLNNAADDGASSESSSSESSSESSSSSSTSATSSMTMLDSWTYLFPVLSKINGVNWVGTCRYVNDELIPQKELKLMGGLRFDFLGKNGVELNSYLTFPNGNRRDIEMRGTRARIEYPSMRLDSPKSKNEDGTSSSGPVFMVVTEMSPDTIMINEVEKVSGMIIMTSSLSVVYNDAGDRVKELIQVSHEVSSSPNNKNKATNTIEGHQVWRFYPAVGEGLDFLNKDFQ